MPTILLADEDDAFREVAAYRLERAGFDVVQVDEGEEAWQRVRAGRFEVVVTGARLPGLGGLELARRIDDEMTDPPPVLGLVGEGRQEEMMRCLEQGTTDCVEKPVSLDELVVRVRRLVGGGRENVASTEP